MKDVIISIFQEYPFLQTEWFYTALGVLLGVITSGCAFYVWRKDSAEKKREEHMQTAWQQVQADMQMDSYYRDGWAKIASFDGDAKTQIYQKNLSEIKDDEIRVCINQIMMIMHNVFGYYKTLNIPLSETQWELNFQHVFNPKEMPVFVSAFKKYEQENKLKKDFIAFVNNIINQYPKSDTINDTDSKKAS